MNVILGIAGNDLEKKTLGVELIMKLVELGVDPNVESNFGSLPVKIFESYLDERPDFLPIVKYLKKFKP